jgi:light-regulated signal transduction histidine kinase (bacteriophytochrome)
VSKNLQARVEARTYELERKNEELKKSNVNLEEFAYAASHDMKEPIRKVHYFSDRLKKSLADRMT